MQDTRFFIKLKFSKNEQSIRKNFKKYCKSALLSCLRKIDCKNAKNQQILGSGHHKKKKKKSNLKAFASQAKKSKNHIH